MLGAFSARTFSRGRFQLHPNRRPGFLCAVSRGRNFLKYWLPVLVWMALIYTASGDKRSMQHSSRFIEPVIRWLFPHLADDTVQFMVFLVRKAAHVTEYALLALLLWRALRKPVRRDPRPWQWSQAGFALLCAALYASSDEIHQLFVPHREGRIQDVMIDTSGAALGLLALWLLGKCRKKWGNPARFTESSPPELAP